ncbi:hypothetical protein KSP39_PZI019992 [Platanthera zijinensis]|uniref:2-(3-amino-3-carboxypropyl)histidine synthase subunit 2 n=1 Tax=Platanthera zijinensis TaxID=2320716 RepID=A0AAP0FX19_9ASPA
MDLESKYEISRTADFIRSNNFVRVALQFPDELLKVSTLVAKALKSELGRGVRLFVMADTAYGSCCVDEVSASHVDAECLIHYGHACMSPTTTLPAFFVFGKASIDVTDCVQSLHHCLSTSHKPILVLFGLEYAHALQNIKSVSAAALPFDGSSPMIQYAKVASSIIYPSGDSNGRNGCDGNGRNGCDGNGRNGCDGNGRNGCDSDGLNWHDIVVQSHGDNHKIPKSDGNSNLRTDTKYGLGGLKWCIPVDYKINEYLFFWIGSEDSAFSNFVLTFNNCEIVRYDAEERQLREDFSHQKKTLMRRYYLVEKAKDANIVGILVGTLAVAGYRKTINQMKELIEVSGKKSYILVMGRPNSAKLANFPECDIFVYVSCAQTALLDSKEFLAPVITPFEAVLAFSRGKEWTGEYMLEFRDLIVSSPVGVSHMDEARFSFIKGGYVEDVQFHESGCKQNEDSLALAEPAMKALSLSSQPSDYILFKGSARSGADFFAARSFQGLKMQYENPSVSSYIVGRSGRAAGYKDEKMQENCSA